jgi:hypothetical protein
MGSDLRLVEHAARKVRTRAYHSRSHSNELLLYSRRYATQIHFSHPSPSCTSPLPRLNLRTRPASSTSKTDMADSNNKVCIRYLHSFNILSCR